MTISSQNSGLISGSLVGFTSISIIQSGCRSELISEAVLDLGAAAFKLASQYACHIMDKACLIYIRLYSQQLVR